MSGDGKPRPAVVRPGGVRPGGVRRRSGWSPQEIATGAFSFTEVTALERGFAHVFRDRIVPILRRQEKSRQVMRRKATTGIGASGVAGAEGAAGSFLQGWDQGLFLAPFLGIAAAMGSYGYYQKKWTTGLSSEVIPILCEFLGAMQYGGQTLSPSEFEDLGVVPYHTSSSLDDTVNGNHNGLGYTLTEARLTTRTTGRKGRTRTKTVFKGLMIRIELAEARFPRCPWSG